MGRTLVKKNIVGDPTCEFCSSLTFQRLRMFDRCKRYNAQAHVKTGHAYTGVRLINYIRDNRHMVAEKQSMIFSAIRFCPICGYDYVQQMAYDGKKYKTPISINRGQQ